MAVDELLSNSFEHGCREDLECLVDFKFIRTPHMLMFQLRIPAKDFR